MPQRVQPGDDLFNQIETAPNPPAADQTATPVRAAHDNVDELPQLDDGSASAVVRGIRTAAVAMLMIAWAFLGLLLWIPMLISSAIEFSLAVAGVSLSGKRAAGAGESLNRTVPFYFQVFRNIKEAVDGDASDATQPVRHRMNRRKITVHVVRAAVFWGLVATALLWMLGKIGP